MGAVTAAGGAWTTGQALLFLLLCASFVAFAALYAATRFTVRGKVIAASGWGKAIVAALLLTFFAFLAGLLLPQFVPAAPPA
jgi:phosphatidylglycerophosphate synthase